jgi:hypothetical protein
MIISHIEMQMKYTELDEKTMNLLPQLIKPEDIIYMTCGERRVLHIENSEACILIEKHDGSSLKNAIKEDSLHRLPFTFKLMIIGESMHPMFLTRKKEIYYCNNIEKLNKLGKIEDPIHIAGYYNEVITNMKLLIDDTYKPSEYYVIAYTKGNLYDGTRHFIPTNKLSGEQRQIREIKKKMIYAINRKYEEEKYGKIRKIVQKEIIVSLEYFALYVLFILLICISYMLYILFMRIHLVEI